ncbi:MAG TPA: PKD domain-containing protein, partial [Chitinophagaceae bacterium]
MAFYPFNGNANDVSGNGNHGTLMNGPQLTTDRFGNPNSAYLFDGVNDYIAVPNSSTLNPPNGLSIAAYFNTTSSGLQCIAGKISFTGSIATQYNMGINWSPAPGAFFGANSIVSGCAGTPVPSAFANTGGTIAQNTWHCVVGTFENGTIKIYLDGVLMQTVAGGFTTINQCVNATLRIGMWWSGDPQMFKGKIDDVRIYNRALNQDEVNALCSDLIINDYTPALSLDICKNILAVENAAAFNPGDTVLLIQMKGARIDSTNTNSFGNITNYRNAGNYEFNYVKAKNGNGIELLNSLERQYDFPDGKVQLIRVPYYQNFTPAGKLTCLPWDGSKGGVLVFNVQNTLTLFANVDVSERGFRGGTAQSHPQFTCSISSFFTATNDGRDAGRKGESIYNTDSKLSGRGKLASGGGGGNGTNAGGGGGGNGGTGGLGGNQYDGCPALVNGGLAGMALAYSNASNKIFLGGGGGAGHMNDNIPLGSGGNGGGIVIINANTIVSNGYPILSNGGTPSHLMPSHDDGRSGGGSGGTILLNYNTASANIPVSVKGGNGDYCVPPAPQGPHGPGGGGGGGIIWTNKTSVATDISVNIAGGVNGTNTNFANNPWGATAGNRGDTLKGLVLPIADVLFKSNIDSVRIDSNRISCNSFSFEGLGYTNTNPITNWQWYFGDGGTANTQNTNHTYTTTGTFPVKLVVTDINGCMDSVTVDLFTECPNDTIINDYTGVLSLDLCKNILAVTDASEFNIGDTVLLIQMKGAVIDSTNTAAFGNITDYKNAGNYEFNYIKSKNGNDIELLNKLLRQYDLPNGKVQLVRVPYFQNYTATKTLTCLPWDGTKGGVLALNVAGTINLNSNIDVSGRGFKGGQPLLLTQIDCNKTNYYYPPTFNDAAQKGDGITNISINKQYGRGALGNGGGGGNAHNAGGAGGGNGGKGGSGGNQYPLLTSCPSIIPGVGGVGGNMLSNSSGLNKAFMGGGGGAGHTNELTDKPGGAGGGIVILNANEIVGNGRSIKANGNNVIECTSQAAGCANDGHSGGGAGGSVLLSVNQYLSNLNVSADGGKGADAWILATSIQTTGPGGGGGGGVISFNQPSMPALVNTSLAGGLHGVARQLGNSAWGSQTGDNGVVFYNWQLPIASAPFKPNIDSVRIDTNQLSCSGFSFNGLAYTNTYPVASWLWYFGDGGTANTQNTNHTYNTTGTFPVKLVVTDINGCKDSITIDVTAGGTDFDFSYTIDPCDPLTVQFTGQATGIGIPDGDFGDGSVWTGILSPVHTYPSAGNYVVSYYVSNAVCNDTIRKTISLGVIPDNIVLTQDTTICFGATKQLLTVPALSFCWTPATYLDNPNSPQPITSTPRSITYYYQAEITATNLIINSDFSQGNTGFTSEYNYAANNTTEGQYFVGTNPQTWNSSLNSCSDHTGGAGNMLLVNGSPTANVNVWKQTLTVTPNTNYAFSTWLQALGAPNPAQLQFAINGKDIGSLITASLPVCTWTRFYATWNSGSNTSITISIVNKNTQVLGNDFALDDISFAPVLIKRDSVKITVDTARVQASNDITICKGGSTQLNSFGTQQYSWSPATGLSNPSIANPVATPNVPTQYIVTGTNSSGCSAKDTVNVSFFTAPLINVSNDTAICKNTIAQLFANGGVSYSWTPAATLDNPSAPNPVASPVVSTKYYVVITDANSCNYLDSVQVDIIPSPVFAVSPAQQVCIEDSIQLNASGGN